MIFPPLELKSSNKFFSAQKKIAYLKLNYYRDSQKNVQIDLDPKMLSLLLKQFSNTVLRLEV